MSTLLASSLYTTLFCNLRFALRTLAIVISFCPGEGLTFLRNWRFFLIALASRNCILRSNLAIRTVYRFKAFKVFLYKSFCFSV
ncbi:hypothetical protein F5B18DRAFT_632538 [Nemania serpens]|nr:hypothetical protein F5B18DRAFT_632538 [Nemania serpens]